MVAGGRGGELLDVNDVPVVLDEVAEGLFESEAERVYEVALDGGCTPWNWFNEVPESLEDFVDALCKLKIKDRKTYFFYYAGHGFEDNGCFYFVPRAARRPQGCLGLDAVMNILNRKAAGCTFLLCINACRNSFQGHSALSKACRNAFSEGPDQLVSSNTYRLLFPVPSGMPTLAGKEDEETPFENTVKKHFAQLASEDFATVLTQFCEEFKSQQFENPSSSCFTGMKPPETAYTILCMEKRSYVCKQANDGSYTVQDPRQDQRRRVNRMTAPTVPLPRREFRPPACIIIGNTQGLTAERYRSRFFETGMSANYLISKDCRSNCA